MATFNRNWLYRSIGIVIFVLILRTVDFTKIRIIIETSNHLWLILSAVPLTFIVVFIRFYRWYLISKRQEMLFPFWEGLMIYIASFGLGIVTPGRLGEFIKVNYLRNIGYFTGQSFFTVLLDRFSDIAIMILIALFGSLTLFHIYQGEIIKIVLTGVIITSGVGFSLYKSRNWLHARVSRNEDRKSFIAIFFSELNQIPTYLNKVGWSGIPEIIMVTLVSWLVFFLQAYLFSFSFDLNLTFFQIAFITSTVGLVNMIPISISGLGTRDVTLIFLFSQFGLEKEQALVFSGCMLITIIVYGLTSLIPWEIKSVRNKLVMLKRNS